LVNFIQIRSHYASLLYDVYKKGAMLQLGRRRGAHLPLAAVEPVGE